MDISISTTVVGFHLSSPFFFAFPLSLLKQLKYPLCPLFLQNIIYHNNEISFTVKN